MYFTLFTENRGSLEQISCHLALSAAFLAPFFASSAFFLASSAFLFAISLLLLVAVIIDPAILIAALTVTTRSFPSPEFRLARVILVWC